MKVECPHCHSGFWFSGYRAGQLRKAAMNCPNCGLRLNSSLHPTMLNPSKPANAITSCAILSSGNRLQVFDVPCIKRPKNTHFS